MQTLSVIFLKDEMPEIKDIVTAMKQCEILSEKDIPGSELVIVTMMVTDPLDLYSIGMLVGINRSQMLTADILKKLHL